MQDWPKMQTNYSSRLLNVCSRNVHWTCESFSNVNWLDQRRLTLREKSSSRKRKYFFLCKLNSSCKCQMSKEWSMNRLPDHFLFFDISLSPTFSKEMFRTKTILLQGVCRRRLSKRFNYECDLAKMFSLGAIIK